MGSTIPVKGLIRDITRHVKSTETDYTYDRLVLEMLAQFDPSESQLDGLTFDEQIACVAHRFDMAEEDFDNLVRLDFENAQDTVRALDTESAEADEPVTT